MEFYFSDTQFETTVEILRYDNNDVIADVGGYLGLLLGASVLSIYDVLVYSCLLTRSKRKILFSDA